MSLKGRRRNALQENSCGKEMDPNLKKAIQDYKEKRMNSASAIDCVELERCLREFKTELYIKRDEVNQLRTELDAANLEMQNLRKALDVTKRDLDENKFNLNLQLKMARNNNEELLKKRESLMKIQLQHKMAIAEVDTLKENLQKTEMEKIELSRKVDVLDATQRHNSTYQNDILKRHNEIRSFMENLNEMAGRLQSEHLEAIELSTKTQLASEAVGRLKVCVEENDKLRKAKEQFEEMYIKVNAKYEKLEELVTMDCRLNKPNILTRIIFNQWKINRSHHNVQMTQRDEMLDKMTQSLSNERITNVKLITENDNIKDTKKKLEEENFKLKEMCKENAENIKTLNEKIKLLEERYLVEENENGRSQIKEEPIEIDD